MPIQTPPANWLQVFPWEEMGQGSVEGRFLFDGIHYEVKMDWDEWMTPDTYGTYTDSLDSTQAFYGDRKTGHLWGPWVHRVSEYSTEQAAETAYNLLYNLDPDDPDRKVDDPDYSDDSGMWVVEWEERPLLSNNGPTKWERGHMEFWIPDEGVVDLLQNMDQYPDAVESAIGIWGQLESFNEDWQYKQISVKACYDPYCDDVIGEASLGGVDFEFGGDNQFFWDQVVEVAAEAAYDAVEDEEVEEVEMAEEKIIPRELASTLRQVSYIGTPGTQELGRIIKAANNQVPAEVQDILVAGTMLIKLSDELTQGQIQKGLSAAAARSQYKWMRQAGAELLSLLR